jgi:signal transduction histidine kinase
MKTTFATVLLTLSLAVAFSQVSAFSQSKIEGSASEDLRIKSQVETAISMLETVFSKQQKGELNAEQARQLGAELLRGLRYGNDGYFWADTTEGVNVVLYGRKDVEGKSRLESRDAKGKFIVKDFIAAAKAGGGYVSYWFPKPNQTTPLPKRSYVQLFEPFGWVVGTGYYLPAAKTTTSRRDYGKSVQTAYPLEPVDSRMQRPQRKEGGDMATPGVVSQFPAEEFLYEETRQLVTLVNGASDLIRAKGEAAFGDFRASDSRWRQGETYIFVLDPQGNMLVHPDPTLEGKNQLDLKDINGKPIIRGIIGSVTTLPDKREGWYHYEWPVPGEILPRWKSTYARLVTAPSGKNYIVGSGMYNDRMERVFVVDVVTDAVGQVEKNGRAAFPLFHDPAGPYLAKDAYIFVIDSNGVEVVNPAFPSIEGRNNLDVKDTQGKLLTREILEVVKTKGSGWVDYMWPKPGESVSTQKSAYVRKAKLGDEWVAVGCGVYLADAPKAATAATKMTAPELMTLVREGAAVLEKQGEQAFPEFRRKGSKWFRDDTYLFVEAMDGTRLFHAADPASEGRDMSGVKDILGRPINRMFLDAAASPAGEGWIHYMWPEPGDIFPTWKSTFVKRVTFPSGKQYAVASGIYNMQMDKAFIEDVVNRAAALVAERGRDAFPQLRDKTGPFLFMDTYVFVQTPNGTELVNPAQPSFEGKNLYDLKDLRGRPVVQEQIALAMKDGSGWLELYWYRPGDNQPARKLTYVRKVQFGQDTYIVGSGLYVEK